MKHPPAGVCLAVLLAAVGLASPAFAMNFGDITVVCEQSLRPDSQQSHDHGYLGIEATVRNASRENSHAVTLVFPGRRYGRRGNVIERVSRTVVVGPLSTVSATLTVPSLQVSGDSLAVRIDGKLQDDLVGVSLPPPGTAHLRYGASPTPLALTSARVGPGFSAVMVDETAPARSGGPTVSNVRLARSQAKVDEWPSDWRVYTPYDGIVVTADEMSAMRPTVREAIMGYVECGGNLTVLGPWEPPGPWGRWPGGGQAGMHLFHAGFGACSVFPEADANPRDGEIDPSAAAAVRDQWKRSQLKLSEHMDANQAHRNFPVVEDLSIPARGLFILMLVFVVLVGPFNLLVLRQLNRRIWVLWTAPLISLAVSLAITGYALFSEGWSPYIRTSAVTLLDQTTRRATTLGWTGYYAPLTPGGGLVYSHAAEIDPLVNRRAWRRAGGTARTLELTREQRLESGWVTARVPAHFRIRQSETRRERLAVRRDNGAVVVVNGLGAHLENLWFADSQGAIFEGKDIPPGEERTLTLRTGVQAMGTPGVLNRAFRGRWSGALRGGPASATGYLRPGCYLAETRESPFLPAGLEGYRSWRRDCVVYGITEEALHGR